MKIHKRIKTSIFTQKASAEKSRFDLFEIQQKRLKFYSVKKTSSRIQFNALIYYTTIFFLFLGRIGKNTL